MLCMFWGYRARGRYNAYFWRFWTRGGAVVAVCLAESNDAVPMQRPLQVVSMRARPVVPQPMNIAATPRPSGGLMTAFGKKASWTLPNRTPPQSSDLDPYPGSGPTIKGRVGTKRPRRALRVCAAFSESAVLLYSARPASLPPRMARAMLKGLAQSPMA